MRRRRTLVLIALAAAAAAASALAGWLLVREISPQYLQVALAERLSGALATPVTIEKLTISRSDWAEIDGRGVRAWSGEQGAGLEIPRVRGSIDLLSVLVGKLRLRALRVEGAVLRTAAIREQRAAASPAAQAPGEALEPEPPREPLQPLIALELAVRYLFESFRFASTLDLENGRIELGARAADARETGALQSERESPLELRELSGQLVRQRFGGESRLSLAGRLVQGERDLGAVELAGVQSRRGRVRIALRVDSLELAISDRYVRAFGSEARIDGSMSGEITYETPEPGSGHLEIDLVCERLRSEIPAAGAAPRERGELSRVELNANLVVTPQSLAIHQGVIATPQTSLRVSGTFARPLQSTSMADVSVEFDDVEVSQVRHLIGWLPEIEREEAAAIVAPLRSGRLVSLRASGAATLLGWQNFLAGRTHTMPADFRLGAELADTVIWVGDSDRIEELRGKVSWIGERVAAKGVTAVLNGNALPSLDLAIDGFPNFFASDKAAREIVSGAEPLTGLETLWRSLSLSSDMESESAGTTIELHLDYVDHPMFLWPIRDLELAIETEARGLRVEKARGEWAGVPIDGAIEWHFVPDERVHVELTAARPSARPFAPTPENTWARGRFEFGRIDGETWRQRSARGAFEASEGSVQIHDLAIDLEPKGTVEANGRLRLSEIDAVPFRLGFDLKSGEALEVAKLFGLPPNLISGEVDLAGLFDGTLLPEASIYASLTGSLHVSARDGWIRKKSPPMTAVSRASEALEDFDPSEVIRYQTLDAKLEFEDGMLRTDAFSLDGPQIGVIASGEVDLMSDDKRMNGNVGIFLFPKLDQVLGKIPILNRVLLGTDENLVAAYFEVKGPWDDPEVKQILLPGSAGSTSVVLQGVPLFVKRGFKALGSLVRPGSQKAEPPRAADPPPPPANELAAPASGDAAPPAAEPPAPPASDLAPAEVEPAPSPAKDPAPTLRDSG